MIAIMRYKLIKIALRTFLFENLLENPKKYYFDIVSHFFTAMSLRRVVIMKFSDPKAFFSA